jgi:hypothetical protein
MFWLFGLIYGNLVIFFSFWYIFPVLVCEPRKIWQPCSPLAWSTKRAVSKNLLGVPQAQESQSVKKRIAIGEKKNRNR